MKVLVNNPTAIKRAYEESKSGTIHSILKKTIQRGKAAEREAKAKGNLEQMIDRKLAPVVKTIQAHAAEIDEATADAFRMAAEMSKNLKLNQQEQRVYDALIETAGNELGAAQSLITRYGKTKKYTVTVKDSVTGEKRKLRRTKGSGYSRANVQLIRERIEKKIGATGYTNPRTFWAKPHPLAHTVPDKPTGKKTGTMPAR